MSYPTWSEPELERFTEFIQISMKRIDFVSQISLCNYCVDHFKSFAQTKKEFFERRPRTSYQEQLRQMNIRVANKFAQAKRKLLYFDFTTPPKPKKKKPNPKPTQKTCDEEYKPPKKRRKRGKKAKASRKKKHEFSWSDIKNGEFPDTWTDEQKALTPSTPKPPKPKTTRVRRTGDCDVCRVFSPKLCKSMVNGKWRVCVSCAEKEKNASLMKNLTLTVSNPQICTQELGDPKALALVWECFQTLGKDFLLKDPYVQQMRGNEEESKFLMELRCCIQDEKWHLLPPIVLDLYTDAIRKVGSTNPSLRIRIPAALMGRPRYIPSAPPKLTGMQPTARKSVRKRPIPDKGNRNGQTKRAIFKPRLATKSSRKAPKKFNLQSGPRKFKLQKKKPTEKAPVKKSRTVHRILESRLENDGEQFLVWWSGSPMEQATWEKTEAVEKSEAYRNFNQNKLFSIQPPSLALPKLEPDIPIIFIKKEEEYL